MPRLAPKGPTWPGPAADWPSPAPGVSADFHSAGSGGRALSQAFFGFATAGCVSAAACDESAAIGDEGDVEFERDQAPILGAMEGLEPAATLALQLLHVALHLLGRLLALHFLDGPAQQFHPVVTQDSAVNPVRVDDVQVLVHFDHPVEGRAEQRPVGFGLLRERGLHPLVLRDVARDADDSGDVAVRVAQGNLGGRDPGDAPVGPGLLLLQADERRAGAHDALLILVRLPGVLLGEKVEVRLADRLTGITQSEDPRHGVVDAHKATVPVLEIDVVGNRGGQALEKDLLMPQCLLRPPARRDVLRHEAAFPLVR